MQYKANEKRYDSMEYRKCGESGLKLPAVSLGLWHNFGDNADFNNMCNMCFTAFDNGITHFDLANNYGPYEGTYTIGDGTFVTDADHGDRYFFNVYEGEVNVFHYGNEMKRGEGFPGQDGYKFN